MRHQANGRWTSCRNAHPRAVDPEVADLRDESARAANGMQIAMQSAEYSAQPLQQTGSAEFGAAAEQGRT